MINIIETSTAERELEFQEKYSEFRKYYDNTDMLMKDIWKKIGLTPTCSTGKAIRRQLRIDGADPLRRGHDLRKSAKDLVMLPDFRKELRNGNSIDETLKKYNLTFEDAVRGLDKPNTKPMQRKIRSFRNINSPHIYKQGPYFFIQKTINLRTYNFGTYNTLEDAEKVRDYFLENGWNHDRLDDVCEELGVERRRR